MILFPTSGLIFSQPPKKRVVVFMLFLKKKKIASQKKTEAGRHMWSSSLR